MVEAVPYLFAYVTLTMGIGCGLRHLYQVIKSQVCWYGHSFWHILSHRLSHMGWALFCLVPLLLMSLALCYLRSSPWCIDCPLGRNVRWQCAAGAGDGCAGFCIKPACCSIRDSSLFNTTVDIPIGPIMFDLFVIVVLPTIVGVGLYELSKGRIQEKVKPIAMPISKLCFVAVVALNASAIAPYVDQLKQDMLKLIPLVIVLVGVCYAVGYFGTAKAGGKEVQVTVSYSTGMRNISLGIVLALGYFSPLAAVPVVLSILVQRPLATVHHFVLQNLIKTRLAMHRMRMYDKTSD